MFLVNSRLGLVSATLDALEASSNTSQVPLIPKLRGYFAEFLHHDYPDRLGILYLSTCVGLGYGRLTTRQRSFSRQHRITQPTPKMVQAHHVSGITGCGFTYTPPYTLSLRQPTLRMSYLPASLRGLPTTHSDHRLNHPPPRKAANGLACLASCASTRTSFRRYGNINPLSIDYACRPRLRSRLTQGRLT